MPSPHRTPTSGLGEHRTRVDPRSSPTSPTHRTLRPEDTEPSPPDNSAVPRRRYAIGSIDIDAQHAIADTDLTGGYTVVADGPIHLGDDRPRLDHQDLTALRAPAHHGLPARRARGSSRSPAPIHHQTGPERTPEAPDDTIRDNP